MRSDLRPETKRSTLFPRVFLFRKGLHEHFELDSKRHLFTNRTTSHRPRSNPRTWSQNSSCAGSRWSRAMKLFSHNSIVPPTSLFIARFRGFRDAYYFESRLCVGNDSILTDTRTGL